MQIPRLSSRLLALALISVVSINSVLCALPPLSKPWYREMEPVQGGDTKFLDTLHEFLPSTVERVRALQRGVGWPIPFDPSTRKFYAVETRGKGRRSELNLLVLPPDPDLDKDKVNRAYKKIEKSPSPLHTRLGLYQVTLDERPFLVTKEMKSVFKRIARTSMPLDNIVELFDDHPRSRTEMLDAMEEAAAKRGLRGIVANAVDEYHNGREGRKGKRKKTDAGQSRTAAGRRNDLIRPGIEPYGGQAIAMSMATHYDQPQNQLGPSYPSHVDQQPRYASGPSSRAGYGPFKPFESQQSASIPPNSHGSYTQFQPHLAAQRQDPRQPWPTNPTPVRYHLSDTHLAPYPHHSHHFDATPAYARLPASGYYPSSASFDPYRQPGMPYPAHPYGRYAFPGQASSLSLGSQDDGSELKTQDLISSLDKQRS